MQKQCKLMTCIKNCCIFH